MKLVKKKSEVDELVELIGETEIQMGQPPGSSVLGEVLLEELVGIAMNEPVVMAAPAGGKMVACERRHLKKVA